jgi:exopolyphosphatase/guanosine-5'-triphosphate,3'-diphosphate pyrophosphatase
MGFRWEWRTFGRDLGAAADRLAALPVELETDSDETYLVAQDVRHAVKARDGLMDVKHLDRVDDDGLQLWRPVMKALLPIRARDAAAVLDVLGVPAPALDPDARCDLAALVAAGGGAVTAVAMHKHRRHMTFAGARAELSDLTAEGHTTRTIAIEHEDPSLVLAAVEQLGLADQPNTSMPTGLVYLVSQPKVST